MIDLLFLAHNRLEFTKASLSNLIANTEGPEVQRLIIYDDNSTDGTREYLKAFKYGGVASKVELRFGEYDSPVAVMNDYLRSGPAEMFAKIDSDTMVPPDWLTECLGIMSRHPELHLLGIEAFRPVQPVCDRRTFDEAGFIGGIGLMRSEAFRDGLPEAEGRRQGFTQFQERHPEIIKGWLNPALPVFLLDWIPREPWQSLTAEYVKNGWNRDWREIFPDLCPYPEARKDLWSWWCE